MKKSIGLLLALGVSVPAITTTLLAEERVAKIRNGTKLLLENEYPPCQTYMLNQPTDYLRKCGVPSISNEAWEHVIKNGQDKGFATSEQLKDDAHTFIVYTKGDMDKTITDIRADITNLQQGLEHNGKVLDDTKRAILLTIDKLPSELPTNAEFYQQMREHLKTDIAAELERAEQGADLRPQ